jgi:hypothetical protein
MKSQGLYFKDLVRLQGGYTLGRLNTILEIGKFRIYSSYIILSANMSFQCIIPLISIGHITSAEEIKEGVTVPQHTYCAIAGENI